MDCINLFLLRNANDVRNVQVSGNGRLALADQEGNIGFCTMGGLFVLLSVNANSLNVQLGTCAEDTYGDLATISNQYFFNFAQLLLFGRMTQLG